MGLLNTITYRRIKELGDINKAVDLQSKIWSPAIVSPQPQLLAAIHNGGIVVGAFAVEQLVGFCYGFAGFKKGEAYLISHMTGILPEYQNAGIGYRLKKSQREWALVYGYKKIVWTYDPLEIRNGYFNVCKLGAYSKHYIPSYYGELDDKLNKGLPTDRLLIEWDICSRRVEDAFRGTLKIKPRNEYEMLLNWEYANGHPIPVELDIKAEINQDGYLIPVPSHFQSIKQHNSGVALEWRFAIRNAITKAFSSGYMITGVQRELNSKIHFYIFEKRSLVKD
jgi:predicted GNAT superfamily acetyltransferase